MFCYAPHFKKLKDKIDGNQPNGDLEACEMGERRQCRPFLFTSLSHLKMSRPFFLTPPPSPKPQMIVLVSSKFFIEKIAS